MRGPTEAAYLREPSILGGQRDWEQIRQAADERLDTTPGRAGSYIAITTTLARIGGAHNRLFTPDAVAAFATEVR